MRQIDFLNGGLVEALSTKYPKKKGSSYMYQATQELCFDLNGCIKGERCADGRV